MPVDSPPQRSVPIGALLLLVVACGFYVAVLASAATPLGGGEAAMSDAFASLFLTFGLWVALALLLVNAGLMGEMPRWSAILAVFVVPLSGVAAFVAIDMCSRRMNGRSSFRRRCRFSSPRTRCGRGCLDFAHCCRHRRPPPPRGV
jgi:hypothetical protein